MRFLTVIFCHVILATVAEIKIKALNNKSAEGPGHQDALRC